MTQGSRHCEHCGTAVAETAQFCPHCGARFEEAEAGHGLSGPWGCAWVLALGVLFFFGMAASCLGSVLESVNDASNKLPYIVLGFVPFALAVAVLVGVSLKPRR